MKRFDVRIKRVYEPAARTDGARLLIDRLWPRGVRKDRAALDDWLRDVAPSPSLRRWFGHDPERFAEFRKRYRAELTHNADALDPIRRRLRDGPVTLVYGAHDPQVNHAVVLQEFLNKRARRVAVPSSRVAVPSSAARRLRASSKRPVRPSAR